MAYRVSTIIDAEITQLSENIVRTDKSRLYATGISGGC
jgi:predicted peptidase